MQAIGERLREARMRQGLDITEVEVATKIRAKYLRALENDEFRMLPGPTYVRSFLRTYAEYLGLDAQLLVEEFRAQHEPRGEEVHHLAPVAARPGRERRVGGGYAIGPATVAVGAIVVVLIVLAIIGLASGDNGGGGGKRPHGAAKAGGKKAHHAGHKAKSATARPPSTIRLKVIPVEPTYLCLDNGSGTKLFEGTVTSSQSFREKRLRILLGRSSAKLYVNGKPVRFDRTASVVSFSFSRTGRVTPLAPGQRPCA